MNTLVLNAQLLARHLTVGALSLLPACAVLADDPGPPAPPPAAEAIGSAQVAVVADEPLAPPSDCPETVQELPESSLFEASDKRLQQASLIVVLKERRRIARYASGALHRGPEGQAACWEVGLGVSDQGSYPPGHKTRQGDRRTPEGWYRSSDKPWSQFYGAIAVHYPNRLDASKGLERGLINQRQHDEIVASLARGAKPLQNTRLGGEILIHGGGAAPDWTLGCVAMNNPALDTLRAELPAGMATNVLILP